MLHFTYVCCFSIRFLMVFTCLTLSVFQTIDDYDESAIIEILYYMESFVVVWFGIEFGVRYV